MRGVLQFKLPEEREEFELAQQASALLAVLSELNQFIRNRIKYQDLDAVSILALESVRTRVFELCNEYGVHI